MTGRFNDIGVETFTFTLYDDGYVEIRDTTYQYVGLNGKELYDALTELFKESK